MQDESIIELFFKRSEQGLAEMEKKYGRLCRQVAYNILSNSEDADEAVNMAYMRIWNAIPPARPKSLCGYICTAVRNTALNSFDALKRRRCEEYYDELTEVIADTRTVEDDFDSRQIGALINEFLERTSKKSRQIFTARYYYNMSVKEIAESSGYTETAVKTRLSRTRAGLRKFLEERGVDV